MNDQVPFYIDSLSYQEWHEEIFSFDDGKSFIQNENDINSYEDYEQDYKFLY